MDYEAYADDAVRLVNDPLDSLGAARGFFADRTWMRDHVREADLPPLRSLRNVLAAIVDSSAAGDGQAVVRQLNQLLEAHPIRPRIAGHDASTWHLHIVETGSSVADVATGEALLGLTLLITDRGPDRLGRCAAPGCARAFIDTSPNRSRRFCGTRCATRVNVAAHRSRQAAGT